MLQRTVLDGGNVAPTTTWVNKIVGYGEIVPDQALANPGNWRIHPLAQQAALGGVLREIGVVQNIIINRRSSPTWGRDQGVETVLDGHLRVAMAISAGQPTLPVTYVDLDPTEEATALATFDPVGTLAATDASQLAALLHLATTGDDDLRQFIAHLDQSTQDLLRASTRAPNLDKLAETFGTEINEEAFWPVVKLSLPPDIHRRFTTLLAALPGDKEWERVGALCEHLGAGG